VERTKGAITALQSRYSTLDGERQTAEKALEAITTEKEKESEKENETEKDAEKAESGGDNDGGAADATGHGDGDGADDDAAAVKGAEVKEAAEAAFLLVLRNLL
jgi:hypothetical protein